MDPNATLASIREIVAGITAQETTAPILTTGETYQFAYLVEALDWWLSKGGFLPSAWER